jgi:4-diphosphocytidyl-2-C-methyl-D-erythritol kinase
MDNNYCKKSYAKVNIFLKIAGKRGQYHELVSRFMRVKNLYDTISFVPGNFETFTLEGDFGCDMEKNTIYKVYLELSSMYKNELELFKHYKVLVEKKIPEFAGLGGGSSNAATFLLMTNELCNLGLTKDQMATIGLKVGADVPFFVYEYDSANVTGIGEIVKKFDEEPLDIQTYTPSIKCNTGKIFQIFRSEYYKEVTQNEQNKLLAMKSFDIMSEYNIKQTNDLYEPARKIYSQLEPKNFNLPQKTFFSGSGSSFFYIKNLK